jgi:hypothetical protein
MIHIKLEALKLGIEPSSHIMISIRLPFSGPSFSWQISRQTASKHAVNSPHFDFT